ncbi:MAG: DUF1330 domain-containing protein [Proteobacteria bacterium]|nr:DUF1330 domain-containing protein [Pseudomonadota bacterium]
MTTYVTAALTITDPSWIEAYGPPVHALVEKHGGRYLAQTSDVTKMEGDDAAPNVVVLLAFPNQAAVEALYADPDYKPWFESRKAGSNGPVLMFDGL